MASPSVWQLFTSSQNKLKTPKMIVKKNTNHLLVSSQSTDFKIFKDTFSNKYISFENHIILDLTGFDKLDTNSINGLLQFAKTSRAHKKSFIIVAQNIDIDAISEEISCVPTLLEAQDTLEMDNMERDLGF